MNLYDDRRIDATNRKMQLEWKEKKGTEMIRLQMVQTFRMCALLAINMQLMSSKPFIIQVALYEYQKIFPEQRLICILKNSSLKNSNESKQ